VTEQLRHDHPCGEQALESLPALDSVFDEHLTVDGAVSDSGTDWDSSGREGASMRALADQYGVSLGTMHQRVATSTQNTTTATATWLARRPHGRAPSIVCSAAGS
jgi:hypothetical protein